MANINTTNEVSQNAAGPQGAVQYTRQADGADIPLNLPELYDFTIEGKPTKTIETPWGPREVYDALQDEELRVIFDAYIRAVQTDAPDKQTDKLFAAVVSAELANNHDFSRIGCNRVLDNLCVVGRAKASYADCSAHFTMGSPVLSECEKSNQTFIYDPYPDGEGGVFLLNSCNTFSEKRPNIRDTEYLKGKAPEDVFKMYYERTCCEWLGFDNRKVRG